MIRRLTDEDGDSSVFRNHAHEHYEDLFGLFSDRAGDDVDLTPVGITRIQDDNVIEYNHGSGFDGKQPEFHGHLEAGVALAPMFCPWCVFDEDLALERRMLQ